MKSGVDTNDERRWETMLAVQSMIDQFVVTMYVANIHSAHEGLLSKQRILERFPLATEASRSTGSSRDARSRGAGSLSMKSPVRSLSKSLLGMSVTGTTADRKKGCQSTRSSGG